MIDSTGKYPTGFIQGTAADIGAFDECIETVALDEYGHEKIRGQYCVLQIKVGNDTSLIDGMLPAARMTHKRVSHTGCEVTLGVTMGTTGFYKQTHI